MPEPVGADRPDHVHALLGGVEDGARGVLEDRAHAFVVHRIRDSRQAVDDPLPRRLVRSRLERMTSAGVHHQVTGTQLGGETPGTLVVPEAPGAHRAVRTRQD